LQPSTPKNIFKVAKHKEHKYSGIHSRPLSM